MSSKIDQLIHDALKYSKELNERYKKRDKLDKEIGICHRRLVEWNR